MITLYQESVPFTNKKTDGKISQDSAFTNPVIMPYTFDYTGGPNKFETVFYIKNDDQSKWYKHVFVGLGKSLPVMDPVKVSALLTYVGPQEMILSVPTSGDTTITPEIVFEDYEFTEDAILLNSNSSDEIIIGDDGIVSVRFSYGYDELSDYAWDSKKYAIIIPYIGNSSMADMSYIPIRMRITLKSAPLATTLRDYFISVSYMEENDVTG